MKKHRFIVTVKTTGSRGAARTALLRSFGVRQPDGCEFHATEYRKPKPEVVERIRYVGGYSGGLRGCA